MSPDRHLTALQLAVMRSLWRRGEARVNEVHGDLTDSNGLAPTTVATLLKRLEARGVVERGDQRGNGIGFPTANLAVPKMMAWPADAVYAGWCTRADGSRHACAINIGRRPTFYEHTEQSLLEAHLIDFEGDLYGEELRVPFVDFLRSERKFDGLEHLVEQLKLDIDDARALLHA